MNEHYWMSIFDAVALALGYLEMARSKPRSGEAVWVFSDGSSASNSVDQKH